MQKILVSAAIAALSVTVAAQTTFVTPSANATKSGNRYAYNFGMTLAGSNYTNVHYQCTDDTMPTGKATLMQMDWRTQTYYTYSSTRGQGRTLMGVNLGLAHAAKTLTRTMSTNYVGSMTTVYSSATLTFASITSGKPTQTWGNVMKFPFSTNFMWDSSKGDLLQDWQHKSGKLANGATWSSTFYLDGNWATAAGSSQIYTAPSSLSTATSRYVPKYYYNSGGGACNDSALTSTTTSAYSYLSFYVYADNHGTTSYQGRFRVSGASVSYVAPGAPLIAMLSLGGSDAGVAAGALCNKVHVNTLFPLAIIAKKAGTSTFSAYTSFTGTGGFPTTPAAKWDNTWAGQTVYWQSAWDDSAKKAFSLTYASKLVLPKKPTGYMPPPGSANYVYKYWYRTNTTRTESGPWVSTYHNPIEQWTKK